MLISMFGLLLVGYAIYYCWFYISQSQIQFTSKITDYQAEAIQNEFRFKLPEGAQIVQCSFTAAEDNLFTVAITGVSDIDAFVQRNLQFEVVEHVKTERFSYADHDRTDRDRQHEAKHYIGWYGNDVRDIYIYSTDTEMVIEIEKSGIVSPELSRLFEP